MNADYEQMTRSQLLATAQRLQEQCQELARLETLRAELEVHRHELQAQHDQLREAQVLLESSRDAYAELYDFAPVPYFTLDRNGLVKEANLIGCLLLEIERERLVGLPLYAFIDQADRPVFLEHLRRCRSGGLQVSSELTIKTRSEMRIPVLINSRVPAAGQVDTVRTVMTDLTERRQSEAEIRNLNAHLEQRVVERTAALERANEDLRDEIVQRQALEAALRQSDRMKDEFLAMLGHELRNPLGPLSHAIEIWRMAGGGDSGELKHICSIAERQVRHMAQLVDDLLDMSRISRGKIVLRRSAIDLVRVIHDVVSDFRTSADTGGVQLNVEVGDAPVWIMADVTRMAQVVGNLLHNAIKFTPRDGAVTVSAEAVPENSVARLVVRDTGMGIEPERIGHVFSTFYQSETGLDRKYGGLGLGLALVKGLVELHGGKVQATSAGTNRGAEFTVHVPLCEAPEQQPGGKPPLRSKRRYRILVVDDQSDTLYAMNALLMRLGHEVVTAQNGEDAIRAATDFRPDVIFSDIGLPGMDGYAIARRIRSDPSLCTGRLVAVTGYGQTADQERAYEAGFDRHLTKPVSAAELCRVLDELPGVPLDS